ncbi:MAG: hypothetical protein ACRDKU_09970 [Gaiellaceae bacterium]
MSDKPQQPGRPEMDDDATAKLRPEDETQEAREGTKVGLLSRSKIMADFKKIVRGSKN